MSDNDDAIVGTILARRQMLLAAAHAGAGLLAWNLLGLRPRSAFAADSKPPADLVASPVLTEGPFFVDEKLNRSNLIGDTTRASVALGLPLLLNFTVYQLADKKLTLLKDATIDVWHCDAAGVYSDESNPMNHEDTSKQTWLRGYQVTDKEGVAAFQTIVPGWYPGRTAHIHFKVRQFSSEHQATSEFTSQLFFSDEQVNRIYALAPYNARGKRRGSNTDDGIYSERLSDGTLAGEKLQLKLSDAPSGKGVVSNYSIVLTNENMRGRGRGGGPGGGGPGGGGPRGRSGRPPGPPPDGRPFDGPPPGGPPN